MFNNVIEVKKNVSLKNFNSFNFDVNAESFYIFDNLKDLDFLIDEVNKHSNYLFLGQGTNIVFSKDYLGIVVHISTKGIDFIEDYDHVFVKVAAGEIWDDFVKFTLNNSWYGLENLISIPGTVGASPVQNIGAYGVEVKNYIHKVYCIDVKSKKKVILNNKDCKFFYRDSIFKSDFGKDLLILEVEFKLNKKFIPNLSYDGIKKEYFTIFKTKQVDPILLSNLITKIRFKNLPDYRIKGNVGSLFKNPIINKKYINSLKVKYPDLVFYPLRNNMVKISAGWLIDKLNLKNYSQGGMKVYDKQALVIINEGQGLPEDLIKLKDYIKNEVYKNFNLELELEPLFV